TKENTTLFASDRDMFVFLADEDRRIEVPGRRNGSGGSMARGFFVWNSEVGDKTLGLGFFLFDYVCCNRIVWGADQYTESRTPPTAGIGDSCRATTSSASRWWSIGRTTRPLPISRSGPSTTRSTSPNISSPGRGGIGRCSSRVPNLLRKSEAADEPAPAR